MLPDFLTSEFSAMCQVVLIDLVLAGDNAIVVGMAAAGVVPADRRKVICYGIALAVVLRILFATLTMQLLDVIGLTLAGGLLLLWVCWKLYRELGERRQESEGTAVLTDDAEIVPCGGGSAPAAVAAPIKTVRSAVIQVAVADISMSLDNVLAVAGAANEHLSALIVGLMLSVVLMGIGAALIASLLQRHQWIGYLGLAVIAYVAISMIWRGGIEVMAFAQQ